MTKKQIGAYDWNFECNRIRQSTTVIGESLLKIIESNPGPQTLYALVAKMAVQNQIITDAITKVQKIGAKAKDERIEPL